MNYKDIVSDNIPVRHYCSSLKELLDLRTNDFKSLFGAYAIITSGNYSTEQELQNLLSQSSNLSLSEVKSMGFQTSDSWVNPSSIINSIIEFNNPERDVTTFDEIEDIEIQTCKGDTVTISELDSAMTELNVTIDTLSTAMGYLSTLNEEDVLNPSAFSAYINAVVDTSAPAARNTVTQILNVISKDGISIKQVAGWIMELCNPTLTTDREKPSFTFTTLEGTYTGVSPIGAFCAPLRNIDWSNGLKAAGQLFVRQYEIMWEWTKFNLGNICKLIKKGATKLAQAVAVPVDIKIDTGRDNLFVIPIAQGKVGYYDLFANNPFYLTEQMHPYEPQSGNYHMLSLHDLINSNGDWFNIKDVVYSTLSQDYYTDIKLNNGCLRLWLDPDNSDYVCYAMFIGMTAKGHDYMLQGQTGTPETGAYMDLQMSVRNIGDGKYIPYFSEANTLTVSQQINNLFDSNEEISSIDSDQQALAMIRNAMIQFTLIAYNTIFGVDDVAQTLSTTFDGYPNNKFYFNSSEECTAQAVLDKLNDNDHLIYPSVSGRSICAPGYPLPIKITDPQGNVAWSRRGVDMFGFLAGWDPDEVHLTNVTLFENLFRSGDVINGAPAWIEAIISWFFMYIYRQRLLKEDKTISYWPNDNLCYYTTHNYGDLSCKFNICTDEDNRKKFRNVFAGAVTIAATILIGVGISKARGAIMKKVIYNQAMYNKSMNALNKLPVNASNYNSVLNNAVKNAKILNRSKTIASLLGVTIPAAATNVTTTLGSTALKRDDVDLSRIESLIR